MKTWTKMQKEGQKRLTGLERGKPYKKTRGKWQKNWWWALSKSERERKVWKTSEKWVWTSQTQFLKKTDSWFSIDRNR